MKSPRQWFQQLFHQKRRVFVNQGRIHLELRDINLEQLARLEKLFHGQVCALDGIYWCVYNQALHRFVIAYQPEKLTRDPGFNATLGAHYLGEQIDAFGGSYILTFIAYNAGPRKVPEWIERYGDPRGKSIDEVVDWIERIPFPETRNYVMRVMENYQVYKSRLGQKTDIVHDLRFGR